MIESVVLDALGEIVERRRSGSFVLAETDWLGGCGAGGCS